MKIKPFRIISLSIILMLGCVKEKEKIIYVSPSKISEVFPKNALLIEQYPRHYISEYLKDTIISKKIDLNQDGINDIEGSIEYYHEDTIFYYKKYLKKLNYNIDIINNYNNSIYLLNGFYASPSYVTPYQADNNNLKDSYLMSKYRLFKCFTLGNNYICESVLFEFFKIPNGGAVSFGFRLKNTQDKLNETDWKYGYVKLLPTGDGVFIEKIAIENTVNYPILIK